MYVILCCIQLRQIKILLDTTLQRRHNGRDGILNHLRLDCLLNRLFMRRSKKNIKALRHWALWGESAGDRRIPSQRACNAEMFPFDDVIMLLDTESGIICEQYSGICDNPIVPVYVNTSPSALINN